MSKRTIQQSMRIPRDLHEAGTERLHERQRTETKVSLTDVVMDWARKGAIAEGVAIEPVQPRDRAPLEPMATEPGSGT